MKRIAAVVLVVSAAAALADERLEGIACRSVHLGYPAKEATAFYNEMTVDRSAEGTYFMAAGWGKGYFGLQELGNGKKLAIFSVWDPGSQNDPKKVKKEDRVELLYKDAKVRTGRFGNEGTGGQSFYDFDWKLGETYKFLVTAKVGGRRTEYAGKLWLPEAKAWKHLVTFSTITEGKALTGLYSFVEDFRRNKVSTTKVRKARFGNAWAKENDGRWVALTRARFTADANPVKNIDAGVEGGRFFLVTGGATENKGTPLRATMDRVPVELPE